MGHLLPLLLSSGALLCGALLCVCNCAVFKKASVAGELSHPSVDCIDYPFQYAFSCHSN